MCKRSKKGLLVIGAGLPKTGTASLKQALEELLGNKCYHMYEFLSSEGQTHVQFWNKTLYDEAKLTDDDWRNFFEEIANVNATVDYPAALFYKSILKAYPNAKVILTVRSNPSLWFESYKNTINAFNKESSRWWNPNFILNGKNTGKSKFCYSIAHKPVPEFGQSIEEAVIEGEERAINFYSNWIEDVRKTVPGDQLLEFNAEEGWGPLCTFLGLPQPNHEYPRVNDRASFISHLITKEKFRARRIQLLILVIGAVLLLSFAYLCH